MPLELPGTDSVGVGGHLLLWTGCYHGQEGGHSLIELESQVAGFQLLGQTNKPKSAKGTIDDVTQASLSADSQCFLMKQVGINTTGPSALFTCDLACGYKRNLDVGHPDFLCHLPVRASRLIPVRVVNRFEQDVLVALGDILEAGWPCITFGGIALLQRGLLNHFYK